MMIGKILRSELTVLLTLVFFALGCRFYGLFNRGLEWDEVGLWYQALSGERMGQIGPLSLLMLETSMRLFGVPDTPEHIRILPALFGAFTVVPMYYFGKQISGPALALVFAFATAISSSHIHFSMLARPYGFLIFFLSCAFLMLAKVEGSCSFRRCLFFGVAVSLSLLSHLLAILFAVAVGAMWGLQVVIAICKRAPRDEIIVYLLKLATLIAATGLGCLWTQINRQEVPTALEGRYPADFLSYLFNVLMYVGGSYSFHRTDKLLSYQSLVSGFITTVLLLSGLFFLARSKSKVLAGSTTIIVLGNVLLLYFTLGVKGYWAWSRYLVPLYVCESFLVAVSVFFIFKSIFSKKVSLIVACIGILALNWMDVSFGGRWIEKYQPRNIVSQINSLDKSFEAVGARGVIIPDAHLKYGDESGRMRSYFYFYSSLTGVPAYAFNRKAGFRKLVEQERGDFTFPAPAHPVELDVGVYAVLNRNPHKFQCDRISLPRKKVFFTETKPIVPVAGRRKPFYCTLKKAEASQEPTRK